MIKESIEISYSIEKKQELDLLKQESVLTLRGIRELKTNLNYNNNFILDKEIFFFNEQKIIEINNFSHYIEFCHKNKLKIKKNSALELYKKKHPENIIIKKYGSKNNQDIKIIEFLEKFPCNTINLWDLEEALPNLEKTALKKRVNKFEKKWSPLIKMVISDNDFYVKQSKLIRIIE